MRKKKLLLINPVNWERTGMAVSKSFRIPPLGLGVIAALTPHDEWEVEIVDENFEIFNNQNADLVGLTAYTATINRAYEIAHYFKNQGIPTVLGGIHASMLPDEALQFVDVVVSGEAEVIWSTVINDFKKGTLKRRYHGDFVKFQHPTFPRHDLFHPDYTFSAVQTSRGCPMNCDFCSVTAFNGHQYRQRSVDSVLEELTIVPKKNLFFVDDNLIGYGSESEDRAIELFKGMVDRKLMKRWVCQASLNFALNDNVLKHARRSGCQLVILGLEAENPEALNEINKCVNLRIGVNTYGKLINKINRHGIIVLGTFIYGMDSDTKNILKKRLNFILRHINVPQVSFLTPLPGTRLFNRLKDENRLLYTNFPSDWNRYDLSEVVFRPAQMTPGELSESMISTVKTVYARTNVARRFLQIFLRTRNLRSAFWTFGSNFGYRKMTRATYKARYKSNDKENCK